MKKFLTVATLLLAANFAHADLISEFEPNPAGVDPATTTIELSGTAGDSYSGFLTFIDTDAGGGLGFTNNTVEAVSGTYDADGLAVVSLEFDAENPSYTLVFSSAGPAAGDLDTDDDGDLDNVSVFGQIFDAIGIIDTAGDTRNYATQLGGVEFTTPNEFEIAFRDSSTGQFFGVDTFTGEVFDTSGGIFGAADFDLDPSLTTFGAINPTFTPVPEPTTFAVFGLLGLGLVRRNRK